MSASWTASLHEVDARNYVIPTRFGSHSRAEAKFDLFSIHYTAYFFNQANSRKIETQNWIKSFENPKCGRGSLSQGNTGDSIKAAVEEQEIVLI